MASNGSSFSSVTPPLLPENAENNSDSSISENIASSNGSVENDRSFQEIIINNILEENAPSTEMQQSMQQTCDKSDSPSVISLNALENFQNLNLEVQKNVQSILDEILQNEKFHSFGSNSNTLSLNSNHILSENSDVFKNVSEFLSDVASLNSEGRSVMKMREFEDLLAAKETVIAGLTAENDSLKELVSSNPSSVTEYKPYFDDRYGEFQTAIAHRDELIQQLTESLQQSLTAREQLQRESDEKIVSLQQQLEKFEERLTTSEVPFNLKEKVQSETKEVDATNTSSKISAPSQINLDDDFSRLKGTLDTSQVGLLNDLERHINEYLQERLQKSKNWCDQEIKVLANRLDNEKIVHDNEVGRLRELLSSVKCGSTEIMELRQELEASHAKEMEKMRIYYEKKCLDIEKNYSDEVFSQQSRKLSASSSGSEIGSEMLLSPKHQPGPGGDGIQTADELEIQLSSTNKQELSAIRSDLQNKYHAELEILREDYENRIDDLNVKHEGNLEKIERKYLDHIASLQKELDEMRTHTCGQEVANSGDFELAEVVQSYERRLQQQVMLAKLDIISALEDQIQILVESSAADTEWPTELLQLREKLAGHYKAETEELKLKHIEEIAMINEEHEKNIHRVQDRERRRSLRDGEGDNAKEVLQERDNLKKTTITLRHLVGELMKYFTKCEDELNNTLVDELLKYGFDKDLTQIEAELAANLDESDIALSDQELHQLQEQEQHQSSPASKRGVKRVHFTPNVSNFINLIDNSLLDFSDNDISEDFRSELETCLKRLKAEANAVLALSNPSPYPKSRLSESEAEDSRSSTDKVTSLSRKLITETQAKNDLILKLKDANCMIQTLEAERASLDNELEAMISKQQAMNVDFRKAQERIAELIEHKEIVSEGFGESNLGLGTKISTMAELQEKARTFIAESAGMADNPLLPLIEELLREIDRLAEDTKKDRDDLLQQIDAAHKKLRATCQFLEDQAAEREMERDEAQKEIAALREEIHERDKDRNNCERISREDSDFNVGLRHTHQRTVEHLEQQLRDAQAELVVASEKKQETENELKDAVDKVWVLREIIGDLEAQVAAKAESEQELQAFITELQGVISHQTKSNDELNQELDSLKSSSDGPFNDHISHLEDEIQRLRLNTELAGSEGTLKQLKSQLQDIELTLDKRTRELETLHTVASTTTCSSPSEDMSIRDQIQPPILSPTHQLHSESMNPDSDLSLPLQQLARLKDKLIRHSRAEDAAIKRIRDLEMQVIGLNRDFDEVQNERDSLQEQLQEQLVQINSLQMRLDEQRLRAETVENVQNSSLEMQIYDLQSEVQNFKETLHLREKTIKQLNKTIEFQSKQIEEQKQQLSQMTDSAVVQNLRIELDTLKSDNSILQSRIANPPAQPLPGFVESILEEKKTEIDSLKTQLNNSNAELQKYLSLNLSEEQIRNLSQLKSSERALSDIISLAVSADEPDHIRHQEQSDTSLHSFPGTIPNFRKNETLAPITEISSIERIGPSCVNITTEANRGKPNSTEIQKTVEKHVHFPDVEDLKRELLEMKEEMEEKNSVLREYMERMDILTELEINVTKLQEKLESTEASLLEVTKKFEKEMNDLKEVEKNLRIDLAEKKMNLMAKENELEMLEKDSARKDQMYINLAKEKRELEKKLQDVEDVENVLSEKNDEILQLEQQLADMSDNGDKLEEIENLLLESETNLKKSMENVKVLESKLVEKDESIEKLTKELANEKSICKELRNKIVELKDLRLSQSLNASEIEIQLANNKRDVAERDLLITQSKSEIENLKKEIKNLMDSIIEKDKLIHQMSEDSKTLHANLETIQRKMQETGNVLDLSSKLREEQQKNVDLQEEMQNLKKTFDQKSKEASLEEVTSRMKKQLEYSAQMDSNILNAINSDPDLIEEDGEGAMEEKFSILKRKLEMEQKSKDDILKDLGQREQELEMEKENLNKLQYLLEREREHANSLQMQDAHLIETYRIRLETALDNEMEMEKMLDAEKLLVSTLKQKLEAYSNSPGNSKSTETEYKSLPILRKDGQIEIPKVDEKTVEILKNEVTKLKSAVKSLKRINSESEANLKHLNDVLALKIAEVNTLEKKVDECHENNSVLKEKEMRCKLELDQRERELCNVNKKILEIEMEKKDLKKQISDLNMNLKHSKDVENNLTSLLMETHENRLKQQVPDKFLNKLKELTTIVQDNVKDNKTMTETLNKLTEERSQLQLRVRELEDQLYPKLPFDDPVERANFLFGRYMRTESYRKALVWQKRYLVTLLATYQNTTNLALGALLPYAKKNGVKRSKGIARFKSVALTLVAISRMQFLVTRWNSGKRSRHATAPAFLRRVYYDPSSMANPSATYIPATNLPSNSRYASQSVIPPPSFRTTNVAQASAYSPNLLRPPAATGSDRGARYGLSPPSKDTSAPNHSFPPSDFLMGDKERNWNKYLQTAADTGDLTDVNRPASDDPQIRSNPTSISIRNSELEERFEEIRKRLFNDNHK